MATRMHHTEFNEAEFVAGIERALSDYKSKEYCSIGSPVKLAQTLDKLIPEFLLHVLWPQPPLTEAEIAHARKIAERLGLTEDKPPEPRND